MITELDRQLIEYKPVIRYTLPTLEPINNVPYQRVSGSASKLYYNKPSESIKTTIQIISNLYDTLQKIDTNGEIQRTLSSNGHTFANIRSVEQYIRDIKSIDGDAKLEYAIELYDMYEHALNLLQFFVQAACNIMGTQTTGDLEQDIEIYTKNEEELINLLSIYDTTIMSTNKQVKQLLSQSVASDDPQVQDLTSKKYTLENRLDELQKKSTTISELSSLVYAQCQHINTVNEDIQWYIDNDIKDITAELIAALKNYPDALLNVIKSLKTTIYYSFVTENNKITTEKEKSSATANKNSLKGVMDTMEIDSLVVSDSGYRSLLYLSQSESTGLVGKHILQGAVAANSLLSGHALQLQLSGAEYISMENNIVKVIRNKQEVKYLYGLLEYMEGLLNENSEVKDIDKWVKSAIENYRM